VADPTVAYRCDRASFKGAAVTEVDVRWLDPDADADRFVDFCERRGEEVAAGDLARRTAEGFRYAGVIEDGAVVARAARWARTDAEWELAAVATLEKRQRHGLGRAVCSFVTEAIVGEGLAATCHTDRTNVGMRRIAESLGFERVDDVRAAAGR
jgi:GNAT superfamily N-acetyltransferase